MSNKRVTDNHITYDSPGPAYAHVPYPPETPKKWVGLTDNEIKNLFDVELKKSHSGYLVFARAIEAKLKQKNGGNSAVDTELKRLGYPL